MFLRYNPTNCATQNWTNAAESTNLYTYKQVYNRYNMHRGWMQGAMPLCDASLQPKALRIEVYPALPPTLFCVFRLVWCLGILGSHWRHTEGKKKFLLWTLKHSWKVLLILLVILKRQFDNCELKGNIESISCRTLAYLHICTLALSHTHKIFISDGSTCGQEV